MTIMMNTMAMEKPSSCKREEATTDILKAQRGRGTRGGKKKGGKRRGEER